MTKERLIIFVKAPRIGFVKTRIAATAGHERARQIYEELVEKLLSHLSSINEVQLRFTPDDSQEEIRKWRRGHWFVHPQGSGDLGERLSRAFDESFGEGIERVAIIGSDCPEVSAEDIAAALKELKSHDLVLGPAVDGGYWLIGLRAPQSELFRDIPWSSDQVLSRTLARAKTLHLRIQLLRILNDIDTEEDWNAHVRESSL